MSEFKKFSSLENTYNKKFLEKVMLHPCYTGEWIATVKAHGANFSFWWDKENGVSVASRSHFVDDSFFSCTDVINRHAADFAADCEVFNPESVVVVYGELIGGNIQKEVQYGEKRFVAFDVVIDGKVMHKWDALRMAQGMNFETIPVIACGSLEDLLTISPEFICPLAVEGSSHNKAEGIVIEPVEPAYLHTGSRVYLKQKSKAFTEKKDKVKVEKPVTNLSENAIKVVEDLVIRCTEARVLNVLSKIGEVNEKQFGKLFGSYLQDILEEVKREENYEPKTQAGDEWKAVNAEMTKAATPVVRKVFIEQIME